MTSNDLLAQAHNTLVASIEALIQSNDWMAHLKAQAAFHRYSFQNVIWLTCQAAQRGVSPVQFAGFQTWKKMGRFVRKGEQGFKVLAPVMVRFQKDTAEGEPETRYALRGFKVVTTFEKSQTDGRELPSVVTKLQGTSDEINATYAKLAAFSVKRGVSVEKGDTGAANGYYNDLTKSIVVSTTLSDLQALKTLCHEVAHSVMHADEIGSHGKEEREVEAESVAFVVLNALGFDSAAYSFGYVAVWSQGDIEMVRKTGERVQKAAKAILEALGAKGEDEGE